jgi:hypothetical protein
MTSVVITPVSGRVSAKVKAIHLLAEGRVRVRLVDDAGRCRARVMGDSGVWRVSRAPGGQWRCTCPCWNDGCSHIRATRLVVDVSPHEPAGE